jgi:hypothetical protein
MSLRMTSLALLAVVSLVNAANQPALAGKLTEQTVIASWEPKAHAISSIQEAGELLNESRYITATGNEQNAVEQYIISMKQSSNTLSASQTIELALLEARFLQGIHQFEAAKARLSNIEAFRIPSAQLLLADIAIQQGDVNKAKTHCQQLVGQTSYIVSFTCLLNAEFTANPTQNTYEKLKQLKRFAKSIPQKEQGWFQETLAAMALSLGNASASANHLAMRPINTLPISALIIWADANIALSQYENVIDTFGNLAREKSSLDDALLLRWAHALTLSGKKDVAVSEALDERMKVRTWREDSSHAGQVALYYLDIAPNPRLALKFAEINWAHAKTPSDRRILERAQHLNNETLHVSNTTKAP